MLLLNSTVSADTTVLIIFTVTSNKTTFQQSRRKFCIDVLWDINIHIHPTISLWDEQKEMKDRK